jgi:hypothetical protein
MQLSFIQQLSDKVEVRKPALKNRAAPEIEEVVDALAVEQPAFSQVRVADELRKRGLLRGMLVYWIATERGATLFSGEIRSRHARSR